MFTVEEVPLQRFCLQDIWECATAVPKNTGVYRVRCEGDRKIYVGSAAGRRGFRGRIQGHIRALKRGTHHSIHLQRAFQKYGSTFFFFEIVETCPPSECRVREQFFIDEWCPQFNSQKLAAEPKLRGGLVRTPEYRAKLSRALKGRKPSAFCLQRSVECHKHRFVTEATRRKMSASQTGRKATRETIEKRAATRRAQGSFRHTPTSRQKLRVAGARPFALAFNGEVYRGRGMLAFAREHSLDYSHLQKLKRGVRKQHKGWSYVH